MRLVESWAWMSYVLIPSARPASQPTDKHVSDLDVTKLKGHADPEGKYVISTRIRVGRNIRGLGA